MRRIHRTLITFSLLISFTTLSAQEPPNIELGSRVRVTAPTIGLSKYTGTLMATDNDTLVVDTLSIPMRALTGLDVHRGVKSNAGKGAINGGLITGALGLAFTIAFIASDCDGWGCGSAGEQVWGMVLIPAIFALPGAGIGALIGASSTHDKWEEMPLDRFRLSLAPRRDGFSVGLSVRF